MQTSESLNFAIVGRLKFKLFRFCGSKNIGPIRSRSTSQQDIYYIPSTTTSGVTYTESSAYCLTSGKSLTPDLSFNGTVAL